MTEEPDLPLAGVRVLAIEQFGAGPWATLQLADLGADVVKIEDPAHGGDVGRYVPPYQSGEDSLYFEAFNRGKLSVSLDLRHPEGRQAFHRLVAGADVVFSNLRGDQPLKLGLRYEDLRDVNPRIVCCSLTGYGVTGPRAAQGAYDYVIQGLAGWMSITGEPGGPPAKSGLSLVDLSAGYVAAITLMGALWRAARTGRGCDCDVSLLDTATALLGYVGTWTASEGYVPVKTSNSAHPSIVPFQAIPTADGWIVVACPKESLWRALCGAIGRADLLADPRFAGFRERGENRAELLEQLYETFAGESTATWIGRLEPAGVPCGPVNDVATALQDPQVVARGIVQEVEHPVLGTVRHVASPLRVDRGVRAPALAPRRGEHTERVLREMAGYSADEIARLAEAGAVVLPAG